MRTISIHVAKNHLSRIVDKAAAGEEIIITRAGRPVARLVPLVRVAAAPRVLGLGKGRFELPDEFDKLNATTIREMFEVGN